MEIFLLHEHSRASFSTLLPNVIKKFRISRASRVETFSSEMIFTRDEISASRSQFYPEALKSLFFFYVFMSLFRSPLEKLFLATSVMRLHRKIFHDTKTLLSKTFFSISTQPLFYSPSLRSPFFFLPKKIKAESQRVKKVSYET